MANDVVNQVRDRTDLVELISQYTPLKQSGRNYKGLCPFHQEKTPSFVVFSEDQHYHCFGCSASGDAFSFYMGMEKVGFGDALKELAERAGVPLPQRLPPPSTTDPRRTGILEANKLAAEFFHRTLLKGDGGKKARDYAEERGLDDPIIRKFRIGYAPESWDLLVNHLNSRNISLESAHDAGLLMKRDNSSGYYDRFRDRLIFPISDRNGEIVGFGGRAFGEQQPKYLNTAQTPVFDKGTLLYGLPEAREAIRERESVIIVEGYMDVVTAHQFGEANVVASMGTAISESQIDQLQRLTKRIILALDADSAGQAATLRSLESTPQTMERERQFAPDPRTLFRIENRINATIGIAHMPPGSDPDSLIRSDLAMWQSAVANATPYMEFLIDQIVTPEVREDPVLKRKAIDRLIPLLRLQPDPVSQDHYLDYLSRRSGTSYSVLQSRLRTAPMQNQNRPRTGPVEPVAGQSVEDYLIAILLRYREFLDFDLATMDSFLIQDTLNRELLAGMATEQQALPLDDFLAPLDPEVQDRARMLVGSLEGTPALLPGAVLAEIDRAVLRLERDHHLKKIAYIRSEIRSSEQANDLAGLALASQQLVAELDRHKDYYPSPSFYFSDIRTTKTKKEEKEQKSLLQN